jgi:serine/threonine-protein kinase
MPILKPSERLGTIVSGRYRFDRILTTGGMSVLFEGMDIRARRPVALKLLKAVDCMEAQNVARFLQETRLTAELRHPHVVDVLDLGEDMDGTPFLVMELLRGESLEVALRTRSVLPPAEALSIVLPIMGALATVHDAGVVHRDVKPDNIFLSRDPRGQIVPKLLDFGIAKSCEGNIETRAGAVLGTPEYMAPEQLLRAAATPATDVFAIGAVLYRCLYGSAPFAASTSGETLGKLARETAPRLVVEGVPAGLCAAVDRALARDPGLRYPNLREFAKALVITARDAGYDVPEEPEPIGLPMAVQWLNDASRRTAGSNGWTQPPKDLGPERRVRASALVAVGLLAVAGLAIVGASRVNRSSGAATRASVTQAPPSPVANGPRTPMHETAAELPTGGPEAPREEVRREFRMEPTAHGSSESAGGASRGSVKRSRTARITSVARAPAQPGEELPVATEW